MGASVKRARNELIQTNNPKIINFSKYHGMINMLINSSYDWLSWCSRSALVAFWFLAIESVGKLSSNCTNLSNEIPLFSRDKSFKPILWKYSEIEFRIDWCGGSSDFSSSNVTRCVLACDCVLALAITWVDSDLLLDFLWPGIFPWRLLVSRCFPIDSWIKFKRAAFLSASHNLTWRKNINVVKYCKSAFGKYDTGTQHHNLFFECSAAISVCFHRWWQRAFIWEQSILVPFLFVLWGSKTVCN